jgi:uncharacterized protein YuzE
VTVHYDKAADTLFIRLMGEPGVSSARVLESEEVRPGIVLDYDDRNRIVSVEIRSVSKQLPEADVGRLELEVA